MPSNDKKLKLFLDDKFQLFYNNDFIKDDPISIPHKFSKKQDIEISAFWTSMISWGNRKSIINSANRLMSLMDNSPYDFIVNHNEKELKKFESFIHRTFQPIDALGFIQFFRLHYKQYDSFEDAFLINNRFESTQSLIHFHRYFFSNPDLIADRTKKHIATPAKKSTCKRINMFLRWMVRPNDKNIDFGIWQKIKPSQLVMPLDVHVERVARELGLITRKQTDWLTVIELTENLRKFDKHDPVKYDYALFGLGVNKSKLY